MALLYQARAIPSDVYADDASVCHCTVAIEPRFALPEGGASPIAGGGLKHALPSCLTVACVLRSGGRYSPIWVKRLKRMVERNLSVPFRFVCLSDIPIDGIEVIPLRHNWPRWWSKMELWSDAIEADRILYLDLDVLITGSLDEIALHPEPIIFCPPHPVLIGRHVPDTKRVTYKYQTSCVSWSPPAGKQIYGLFTPDVMERWRGDQDWIAEVNPCWPTFGREWFRKLRDCENGPPEGVKVVIGGKMKQDATPFRWAKDLWLDRNLFEPEGGVAHSGY